MAAKYDVTEEQALNIACDYLKKNGHLDATRDNLCLTDDPPSRDPLAMQSKMWYVMYSEDDYALGAPYFLMHISKETGRVMKAEIVQSVT